MLPNKKPFQEALAAAKKFSNPQAQSTLFFELAKAQIQTGQLEDALETVALISRQTERRSTLLNIALDAVRENRIDDLLPICKSMLENDLHSASSIGRLALSLLENVSANPGKSMELIRLTDKPFETDRERYRFFEKLIEVGKKDFLNDIKDFPTTFSDSDYRDWGRLALMKALVSWDDWSEAESIADAFSLPRRSSWAFLELSRAAKENEKKSQYLHNSVKLLESVPIDPESNASAIEPISVQYRILGKTAFNAGVEADFENRYEEFAEELLERCEAVVAQITDSFRRLRAQLFLAKVLREQGRLASVRNYIDYRTLFQDEFNGMDRSRLIQWFVEAENSSNEESQWTLAIAEAGRKSSNKTDLFIQDEFSQAERIAEIVNRFALSKQKAKPVNDPKIDQIALSGEEFEEYYFSPFSIDDCGC